MADDMLRLELERVEEEWVGNPTPIVCARFADLLRRSGRVDEALDVAGEGLKQWKDNASISVVLGKTCLDAGMIRKAREILEDVRKKQPQNLVVLKSLAEACFRMEDWDCCDDLLDEYLFENPSDEEANEMQDKARAMKKSAAAAAGFREGPETGVEDGKSSAGESGSVERPAEGGDDRDSAGDGVDDRYPDTERMKKVLDSQGYLPAGDERKEDPGEEENGGSVEEEEEEEVDSVKFLDFFTDEEKKELGLEDYESDENG